MKISSIGSKIAAHAVASTQHQRVGRMRLGYALFRSRQVSILTKFFALVLGALFTMFLIALEIPLEGLVGILLPFFGLVADFAVDGLEVLLMPTLIAILLLPALVGRQTVDGIRATVTA